MTTWPPHPLWLSRRINTARSDVRAALDVVHQTGGRTAPAGAEQLATVLRLLDEAIAAAEADNPVRAVQSVDEAARRIVDEWPLLDDNATANAVLALRSELTEMRDTSGAHTRGGAVTVPMPSPSYLTGASLLRAAGVVIAMVIATVAIIVGVVMLSDSPPIGAVFAPLIAAVAGAIGLLVRGFVEWRKQRPIPRSTARDYAIHHDARTARRINAATYAAHIPLILGAAVLEDIIDLGYDPGFWGPAIGYAFGLLFFQGPAWGIPTLALAVYCTRRGTTSRAALTATYLSIGLTFAAGVFLAAFVILDGDPWTGRSTTYDLLLTAASLCLIAGATWNAWRLTRSLRTHADTDTSTPRHGSL